MANENSIRLQGHEKFALREGWLTKGLNEVENPEYDNVFLEKDAAEIFGLGNNMVKSFEQCIINHCIEEFHFFWACFHNIRDAVFNAIFNYIHIVI